VSAVRDAGVDPCDDFYAHACGGWLESTELPADRPIITRAFTEIHDQNQEILRTILEEAKPDDGPVKGRLAQFYGACMDEATIDEDGLGPVAGDLKGVASIEDLEGLMAYVGKKHGEGFALLFGAFRGADLKNPETEVFHLSQGGLGLPERSYYLDDGEERTELREAYRAHVAAMLELGGLDAREAALGGATVLRFETKLAEISWPVVELRDTEKLHNRLDRAGIAEATPSLSWDAFFEATGRADIEPINVFTPSFFEGLDGLLVETDIGDLRTYLRWQVVNQASALLGSAFVDQDHAFYGVELSGQEELQDRWKRCVDATMSNLDDLMGQAYVEVAFAGESKTEALDMIQRVEKAFEAGLPRLEWMDEATRKRAILKARAITNKIGYPDEWKTYEGVTLDGNYAENARELSRWEWAMDLERVGGPVDPGEWHMPAPMVNAYYNPSENEIAFPAGILQPPFYDARFPRAYNFGSMGMVMGHEITHGFDDDGRKFTAEGKLEDWWEEDVSARFDEQAACVREQYSAEEVQPDLFIDGQLTLGENIADLGGLKVSFEAYQAWSAEHGAEQPVADATPEQLFFLAFAQGWCSIATPEMEAMRVRTDSHSPARWRVNGAVKNLAAFGEAFECEVGSAMRPEATCTVW
jgi:putative endopeptidase